ncbi:MAG: hydrogenase expression/formation protein HypE, partial [Bacteroidales bacterium]
IYKLEKIVKSMAKAAKEGGIMIVTGDTKVVERGKCDGIYISTSGIGSILPNLNLSPKNIQHGDTIIVTAPIAEHGIAILTSREKLGFEGKVKSDTAPLRNMIINLLSKVQHISAIRDATRGGVATVLNEIASISKKAIIIDENILPISKHVAAASALLGLDPLYIANEGVMVVFVPEEYASTALSVIREDKYGKNAVIIGKVIKGEPGEVYLKTIVGTERNLPPLLREQLPRIC